MRYILPIYHKRIITGAPFSRTIDLGLKIHRGLYDAFFRGVPKTLRT